MQPTIQQQTLTLIQDQIRSGAGTTHPFHPNSTVEELFRRVLTLDADSPEGAAAAFKGCDVAAIHNDLAGLRLDTPVCDWPLARQAAFVLHCLRTKGARSDGFNVMDFSATELIPISRVNGVGNESRLNPSVYADGSVGVDGITFPGAREWYLSLSQEERLSATRQGFSPAVLAAGIRVKPWTPPSGALHEVVIYRPDAVEVSLGKFNLLTGGKDCLEVIKALRQAAHEIAPFTVEERAVQAFKSIASFGTGLRDDNAAVQDWLFAAAVRAEVFAGQAKLCFDPEMKHLLLTGEGPKATPGQVAVAHGSDVLQIHTNLLRPSPFDYVVSPRKMLCEWIAHLSQKPCPPIVERKEVFCTDGRWRGSDSIPWGVSSTGQTRVAGYAFYDPSNNTTYGTRRPTREDLEHEHRQGELRARDEYHHHLINSTDEGLARQVRHFASTYKGSLAPTVLVAGTLGLNVNANDSLAEVVEKALPVVLERTVSGGCIPVGGFAFDQPYHFADDSRLVPHVQETINANHPFPSKLGALPRQTELRLFASYTHPLPPNLETVGTLVLDGYEHPLPDSLISVEHLEVQDYGHPLPEGVCAKSAWFSDNYPPPLPEYLQPFDTREPVVKPGIKV